MIGTEHGGRRHHPIASPRKQFARINRFSSGVLAFCMSYLDDPSKTGDVWSKSYLYTTPFLRRSSPRPLKSSPATLIALSDWTGPAYLPDRPLISPDEPHEGNCLDPSSSYNNLNRLLLLRRTTTSVDRDVVTSQHHPQRQSAMPTRLAPP